MNDFQVLIFWIQKQVTGNGAATVLKGHGALTHSQLIPSHTVPLCTPSSVTARGRNATQGEKVQRDTVRDGVAVIARAWWTGS